MNDKLWGLQNDIAEHLCKITKLFNVPVKLTLVFRIPNVEDGDGVVTDDDLTAVITTLEKKRDGPNHFDSQRDKP